VHDEARQHVAAEGVRHHKRPNVKERDLLAFEARLPDEQLALLLLLLIL
jgi:hypothetical protein